jgi:signal transduction histidine kinase
MRIQWKYLLGVNGVLLVVWTLYIFTDREWDRRDMLRLEARSLQNMARVVRAASFERGAPAPSMKPLLAALARTQPGIEIMVIDRRSVVQASTIPDRVGKRWQERDIEQVLSRGRAAAWQYKDHYHGGKAMLDVTVPVPGPQGKPTHAIHVARRMDLLMDLLGEHRVRTTLWALGSVVLIGVVLNLVTFRWLIRPVNRMTEILSSSRWYHRPRRGGGGDQLQRLSGSIHRMVNEAEQAMVEKEGLLEQVQSFNEKLEREIWLVREELTAAQAELVRRERLSAVGTLATGLAHELRNPLHIIRGDAELLSRREENRETCDDILEEVDRINRFVNDLLNYTRPMEPEREAVEVAPAVRSALEAVQRTHAEAIKLEADIPDGLAMEIDPEHLRQILVNLAVNAVQAMGEGGGTLTVTGEQRDGRVSLTVADTGPGIDPDDLERVFEPFFTRRPAGTGLGLAVVKRLVELYGGEISIDSRQAPEQAQQTAAVVEEGGGAGRGVPSRRRPKQGADAGRAATPTVLREPHDRGFRRPKERGHGTEVAMLFPAPAGDE